MMHKNPDPSRLTSVDAAKNTGCDLKGIEVIDRSGERLGTIADFLLTSDGQIDAVIVETFGVLGLGARHVSVKIERLDLLIDPYDKLFLRVEMPDPQNNDSVGASSTSATGKSAAGEIIPAKQTAG